MIDTTLAAVVVASPPQRRRLRLWIALSATVVLLAGGVITAFAVSFHYLHAPVLTSDGGGWLPPDNESARFVRAGPHTATVAAPRLGHAQTFSIEISNPSSVTQTVLGLAYDTSHTAEPEDLAVSTTSTFTGDAMLAHYTSRPVAIPPGGVYTLRLTHHTSAIAAEWTCRSESWSSLELRVRVGAFTRTETVSFGNPIIELRGPCNH